MFGSLCFYKCADGTTELLKLRTDYWHYAPCWFPFFQDYVGRVGDRDYHYGLTPQKLLAARLVFGKFVSLDVASRGYYITRFASTSNRGSEKIGRADASVTVRLFGPHALTVKYLMARRLANYPDLGERDQRRGTFSVFYTLVGDTHLGTVGWRPQ